MIDNNSNLSEYKIFFNMIFWITLQMMSLKSPTALQANIIHAVVPPIEVACYICPELSPKAEYVKKIVL